MAATKSPKPTANKVTVAGTSGLSPRKRIALVAMLVGVLGVGSFWGYDQYQTNQLKAKASNWQTLTNTWSPYVRINACKTSVSSAYGPLWRVQVRATLLRKLVSGEQAQAAMNVYRNGNLIGGDGRMLNNAYPDKFFTVYASQLYDDRYEVSGAIWLPTDGGRGGAAPNGPTVKSITNC